MMRHFAALLVCAGCTGPARPEPIDTSGNEACAFCRMTISDGHTGAQLAAPGEEPRSFDDIGCLRDYLKETPRLPRRAVAYVADHRTQSLVPAAGAVYSRGAALRTPMGSHLFAWSDERSRAGDHAAAGSAPLDAHGVFDDLLPEVR